MSGLATELCGIALQHPIVNGSGTFDAIAAERAFGSALRERFPFAAFVSKTITPEPRPGNPPPRLYETPSGLINSIGLPNKGGEGFVAEDLPRLAAFGVPLIVSVMATDRQGFASLVEAVAPHHAVAGIELNVSCPNVHSGLIVGEDPAETEALVADLAARTPKPLIVKLTPNVAAPDEIARAAESAGARGVSLINTLKAMALSPGSAEPWLGGGRGGLSGSAIRSIALAQVASVAEAVAIDVIGMGGIESGAHAREFLALGARAVAVGTASFRDPAAALRIRAELEQELLGDPPTSSAEAAVTATADSVRSV